MSAEVHEIHPPEPDLDAALAFLKALNPDGYQMLVGYTDESGTPDTQHKLFKPGEWERKRSLITLWASERRNVWVLPNEPAPGATDAKIESIAHIRAVWSDTDSKGVQAAALAALDDPFKVSSAALVSDSGGGIHTFFVLEKPVPVDAASRALAEQVGRGLQDAFGGDPVWNLNRPMRVPGTVNYLNATKRAKGRQIAMTFVLGASERRVTLEQMALDYPAPASAGASTASAGEEAEAMAEIDMDEVGVGLPTGLLKRVKGSQRLSDLLANGVANGDDTGSGRVFRLALVMREEGFTGTEFGRVAGRWHKVGPENITHRQLGRAWLKAKPSKKAERVFTDIDPDDPEVDAAAPKPLKWSLSPAGGKPETTLPRREWLYGRRLLRGYLSSTVAAGGTGKSSLTMAEAVSMASGRNILDIDADDMPKAPLRVLIWNGEDPQQELDLRLAAIMRHHQVTEADLGGRLFMASGRDHPLTAKGAMDALAEFVQAERIDVVMVDPFVSSHAEAENDNMAIDRVAKRWSRLAEACRCGVDLVHHIRKPANGDNVDLTVDDARGASALINASRNARVLVPMSKEMAKLHKVNRRAYFGIQHDATKANMVPGGVGASWFHFVSVVLMNGDMTVDPAIAGDVVGVIEPWVPSIAITLDAKVVAAAQAAIRQSGKNRASPQSDAWVGIPIAGALGLDAKADRKLIVTTIEDWIARGWLISSSAKDKKGEWRPTVEVGSAPAEFDEETPPPSEN